jgi:hypothetical protein
MRIAHIFCALIVFGVGAVTAQQEAVRVDSAVSSAVEDLYLARDDGEGKAGEVTTVFSPSDIPIHCIVVLANANPAAVRMNLVAVKVNGVKPESRIVSASYATSQGQDRVFFTGKPHGKWVGGSYRIDIYVGDKLEKSLAFEVKGGAVPAASNFAPAKPKPKPKTIRKKN